MPAENVTVSASYRTIEPVEGNVRLFFQTPDGSTIFTSVNTYTPGTVIPIYVSGLIPCNVSAMNPVIVLVAPISLAGNVSTIPPDDPGVPIGADYYITVPPVGQVITVYFKRTAKAYEINRFIQYTAPDLIGVIEEAVGTDPLIINQASELSLIANEPAVPPPGGIGWQFLGWFLSNAYIDGNPIPPQTALTDKTTGLAVPPDTTQNFTLDVGRLYASPLAALPYNPTSSDCLPRKIKLVARWTIRYF